MYFLSNSIENGPMPKEKSYAKVGVFCLTFMDLCESLIFVYFCWLRHLWILLPVLRNFAMFL